MLNWLPVNHPDFRYPASKNPYWSKLHDQKSIVYSDQDTEKFAGQWRSRFLGLSHTASLPLHVEIGCNAGHVILKWAQAHPDRLFIGIDWKFKPIFRAADQATRLGLKNIL